MSPLLDDLDTRPGSATSLLRTVIGMSMRARGGWMATTTLVALMGAVGAPGDRTRTALARLKRKGLLVSQARDGGPGYGLSAEALPMLARGDRRIYDPRAMGERDRWCLISYSIPESQRPLRHLLRRRLAWIGCGTVAPALWICPEHLTEDVHAIIAELELTTQVLTFLTDQIRGADDLPSALARWWDLGAIAALHERFLAGHAGVLQTLGEDPPPELAFRVWTRALDAWRPIPYLDPGLPPALLPAGWPGRRSLPLFVRLRLEVGPRAAEFVASTAG